MSRADEAALVAAVLGRALATRGTQQIFVFGPRGAPFWAARVPVLEDELLHLDRALALIAAMEVDHPKPFFAHEPERAFHVAALDNEEDLYVVVLGKDAGPAHAEVRVHAVLLELAPHAPAFRRCANAATAAN